MTWEERIRDTSALGGVAAYVALILAFLSLGKWLWAYQLAGGFGTCYAIAAVIRTLKFETRPDKTPEGKGWFSRIDASSFPSLHAARMFSLVVVLGSFFHNIYFYIFLAAIAVIVAYLRIYLKRHYWWDSAGGAILGLLAGWFSLMVTQTIAELLHFPL